MLIRVFRHHSNTKTTQLDHETGTYNLCCSCQENSRCFIKLQHGNQRWILDGYRTIDVLIRTTVALVEIGEALFWDIVFFHIPIDGGVDIVRVFKNDHRLQRYGYM